MIDNDELTETKFFLVISGVLLLILLYSAMFPLLIVAILSQTPVLIYLLISAILIIIYIAIFTMQLLSVTMCMDIWNTLMSE